MLEGEPDSCCIMVERNRNDLEGAGLVSTTLSNGYYQHALITVNRVTPGLSPSFLVAAVSRLRLPRP